jgi:small subunit ribosomal protein S17e
MGRIKTRKVKSITQDLMEIYGDRFTGDFNENKKKVNELTNVESKKLRNIIAGYATRRVKAEAKQQ